MNWGRIKTILIILFLFTDIFLALSIFASQKKETEISPEVVNATVKILKEHNILVDKSVISPKIPQASVLQADNVISDYFEFARLLLGDGFSQDGENTFSAEDANLTFSGDNFYFEYTLKPDIFENFTANEAQKSAFSYLKGLGFDISGAKIISSSLNGGIYRITARDYAENMPVYSSEVDISLSKNGVYSLSGSWFNRRVNSNAVSSLKSPASILVDFSALYEGEPAEIKLTELGYSVYDSATYHKSASLIPVTKIQLTDGNEYFIDSRSSE